VEIVNILTKKLNFAGIKKFINWLLNGCVANTGTIPKPSEDGKNLDIVIDKSVPIIIPHRLLSELSIKCWERLKYDKEEFDVLLKNKDIGLVSQLIFLVDKNASEIKIFASSTESN